MKLALPALNNLSKKLSYYPLYILIISLGLLLLPLVYIDALTHKSELPKLLLIAIISLSAFISWLAQTKYNPILSYNSLFYLLTAIFIYSLISVLWNPFFGTYQLEIINLACLLILAFTCMQVKNTSHIRLIIFSAVIGGTLSTTIAFFQAWGWNPFNYGTPSFPASSFVNKNLFANYIDLLLPIAFLLLITSTTKKRKWFSSFAISVLFSYLIYSHTRASWLSLLLILVIILYFAQKNPWIQQEFKKTKNVYIIFIVLFSLSLINSPAPPTQGNATTRYNKLYSSLSDKQVESSLSIRLKAYNNAFEMIKEKPLIGTGLGSFQIAFRPYSFKTEGESHIKVHLLRLHNDPLQIIVELGLVGIVLYLTFVLLFYIPMVKKVSSADKAMTESQMLYFGMLLSITASLSHSLLSFPLHMSAPPFLLFIFIGLLLNSNSRSVKINSKIIMPVLFIAIVTSYFILNFYSTFIQSSHHTNEAVKSIFSYNTRYEYKRLTTGSDKNNCTQAKNKINKALNTYSNDFHIQERAYEVYLQCDASVEEHLSLANKILNDNPYHKSALESAALISFNKRNFSASKRYYQVLHYLYPLNDGYSLLLGHIAVKQKEYPVAHQYYLKTLKINSDNTAARSMIKELMKKNYIKNNHIKKR